MVSAKIKINLSEIPGTIPVKSMSILTGIAFAARRNYYICLSFIDHK